MTGFKTSVLGAVTLVCACLLSGCGEISAPSAPAAGETAGQERPDVRLNMCGDALAEGCVAAVSDTTGLIYTSNEGSYDFRLLALEDGAELQTFTEERANAISGPALEDLDQDGVFELVVPVMTGNVNTVYRIHRFVDGRFVLAGEVSGFGFERDAETGLIGVSSRSSAVSYGYHAYMLGDQGLVLAYTLDSDLADRACVLTPGPAFDATGLDANDLLTACEDGL